MYSIKNEFHTGKLKKKKRNFLQNQLQNYLGIEDRHRTTKNS